MIQNIFLLIMVYSFVRMCPRSFSISKGNYSTLMLNDLCSLNINELKKLYLGGNKKLIEFINFEFPRLKKFPPNILYKKEL